MRSARQWTLALSPSTEGYGTWADPVGQKPLRKTDWATVEVRELGVFEEDVQKAARAAYRARISYRKEMMTREDAQRAWEDLPQRNREKHLMEAREILKAVLGDASS